MFSVQSVVRGYHVYQSVWDAACDGKILLCKREVGNTHDPFSVAITKGTTGIVVGHVPRIISPICSIFIRQGGTISCRANGSRRYSSDLPQGGLEVPCILTFSTPNAREIEKTKKLSLSVSVSASIQATTGISATSVPDITIASSSSGKGCSLGCSTDMASCSSPLNLTGVTESDDECKEVQPSRKRQKLNNSEIENIIMGVELSDLHINMAWNQLYFNIRNDH